MENLYYSHIFCFYGLPDFVTSDQDIQFFNNFWAQLTQRLGITLYLSTAYDLETNGQTKNVNKVMEQYLHSFISYQQDDWPN